VFDRSLRSRRIALVSRCLPHSLADEERVRSLARPGQPRNPGADRASWPPTSSSLGDEKRVPLTPLSTSARDPGCFFSPYASKQLNPSAAIHAGEQLIDDLFGDPLVVKVRARHVPPSHRTVQSDQPRDTVPPKIPRPKVAGVVRGPRAVCSSAVRS